MDAVISGRRHGVEEEAARPGSAIDMGTAQLRRTATPAIDLVLAAVRHWLHKPKHRSTIGFQFA